MKIVLERSEVLAILGKHFGTVLDDSKIVIRTEPELEIELRGISMNEAVEETPPARKVKAPELPAPQAEEAGPEDIKEVLEQSEKIRRADRNTITALPSNYEDEL